MKSFIVWGLGVTLLLVWVFGTDARPIRPDKGYDLSWETVPPDPPAASAVKGAIAGAFASGLLGLQFYGLFSASLAAQGVTSENFATLSALIGIPAGATLGVYAWMSEQEPSQPKARLFYALGAGVVGTVVGYEVGAVVTKDAKISVAVASLMGGLFAAFGYDVSANLFAEKNR